MSCAQVKNYSLLKPVVLAIKKLHNQILGL